MEFKDRLKELRQENNISAANLAKQLNKSESAIRMWESGKNKPDADTLIELTKIFDCSVDYMLGLNSFKNATDVKEFDEEMYRLRYLLENMPGTAKLHVLTRVISILDLNRRLEKVSDIQINHFQAFIKILANLDEYAKAVISSHSIIYDKWNLDDEKEERLYNILVYQTHSQLVNANFKISEINSKLYTGVKNYIDNLGIISPNIDELSADLGQLKDGE